MKLSHARKLKKQLLSTLTSTAPTIAPNLLGKMLMTREQLVVTVAEWFLADAYRVALEHPSAGNRAAATIRSGLYTQGGSSLDEFGDDVECAFFTLVMNVNTGPIRAADKKHRAAQEKDNK